MGLFGFLASFIFCGVFATTLLDTSWNLGGTFMEFLAILVSSVIVELSSNVSYPHI